MRPETEVWSGSTEPDLIRVVALHVEQIHIVEDVFVAIARAIVLRPKFIVLDEPTSALDMSVQAQIVDLLRELQQRYQLAYMFISHDLKVVRALSDELIVMRDGRVVELGSARDIFEAPKEEYTKALMAAAFELEGIESGAVRT